MRLVLVIIQYLFAVKRTEGNLIKEFPKNFSFGASTSAVQVEGAAYEDGKGESIFDHFILTLPTLIADAKIASDSYHKYKEDVKMLKDIGFHHYRFSISWSRILPNGHENYINKKGLQYYHNLIDELLENGIEPFVTMFHFDLPQPLQVLGGWANPVMAQYFENYARILFTEFGDKVKWWTTVNEPGVVSQLGYGLGSMPPKVNQPGVSNYLATYTQLIAHAKAYHLYKKHFAPTQKGRIGISIHGTWFKPKTNSTADIEATERAFQFMVGMYAHPIFSAEGDYPEVVKETVERLSKEDGWFSSRLPALSAQEIKELRGSADFFGLNHYTSRLVEACSGLQCEDALIFSEAGGFLSLNLNGSMPTSGWIQAIEPRTIREMLNWIKDEYNNPTVIITESGFNTDSNSSNIDDQERIRFYNETLLTILDALFEDKCNIQGYTVWSLMDTFDWDTTNQFGLYHVDFNNTERTRTKRKSADFFKNVIRTRQLPTTNITK